MYERTYRDLVDADAGHDVNITVHVYGSSENETATSQSPTNSATNTTDGKLALSQGGATAAVDGIVRDVVNAITPAVKEGAELWVNGVLKDKELEEALTPYEVGTYEDGRMRYLLRGTMESLPEEYSIYFKGAEVYKVNKGDEDHYGIDGENGERWEDDGRSNSIMKNSHGREKSITLLLDQSHGSNPKVGDVEVKSSI